MWDTVQGPWRSYLQIPREIWNPSWVVWIAAPNTLCGASHSICPNVLPECSSRFSPFSILLATFSLFDRPVCRMYFASSRHPPNFGQRYHCQLLFNWKVQSSSRHKGFGSLWGKNRRILKFWIFLSNSWNFWMTHVLFIQCACKKISQPQHSFLPASLPPPLNVPLSPMCPLGYSSPQLRPSYEPN